MRSKPSILQHDDKSVYQNVNFERAAKLLQLARFGHDDLTPKSVTDKKQVLGYRFDDVYTDDEHCRIYHNDDEIIVMFEGSDARKSSHHARNLDHGRWHPFHIGNPKMELSEFGGNCRVHPGFAKAMRKPAADQTGSSFQEAIAAKLEQLHKAQPDAPINLIGYSAGGAFAGIMASYLIARHPDLPVQDIYTFAAPRYCGKNCAAAILEGIKGEYMRFEILKDPVPAWPRYDAEYYVHPGKQVVFTTDAQLVLPCNVTKHDSDSYSEAMYAALDFGLHQIRRPMAFMPNYHYLYHYSTALDQIVEREKQYGDSPVMAVPPLHLYQRVHFHKEPVQRVTQQWFGEIAEVVGRHIRRVAVDSPETAGELQVKLDRFNLACGSQHDPINNPSWLEDSFNTLADLYQNIEEKAPLSHNQMTIFSRAMLGLERLIEKRQRGEELVDERGRR